MYSSGFSMGADPEFMLKRGDTYVSAIEIIKGDTGNRINIGGHQFYWDNVMAECAIKPGFSKKEVVGNFQSCLQIYADLVAPCKLIAQASQEYPPEALMSQESQIVGCVPDTCAYMMLVTKPPKDKMIGKPLRSCGGHIHLGQEGGILDDHGYEAVLVIHFLDLFLGIPSLFIDKDPTSTLRRFLYGQAGRYRVQEPYGMEYRSLGNFWLSSPKLVELIYDICDFTIWFVEKGRWKKYWDFDEELYWDLLAKDTKENPVSTAPAFICKQWDKFILKNCIDNCNQPIARRFLRLSRALMPDKLFERIMLAIKRKEPYDLYKEWNID